MDEETAGLQVSKQTSSPRPIHRPSSKPPRHILLLASAFLRKGEKAAAATANLHRHINKDQHFWLQLFQAQPSRTGESQITTAHLRMELAPMVANCIYHWMLAVNKKAFKTLGSLSADVQGRHLKSAKM